MKKPATIEAALEAAEHLRERARALEREADALETEWTGVHSGQIVSVKTLVKVIQRIAG